MCCSGETICFQNDPGFYQRGHRRSDHAYNRHQRVRLGYQAHIREAVHSEMCIEVGAFSPLVCFD